MTDIGALRPAKLAVDFRFKWQDRKNEINERAHRARAARTPKPNGWRNIFHDWKIRQSPAHAGSDTMREIRRIDKDEDIGRQGDDGIDRLAQPPQYRRQFRNNRP